MPTIQSDAILAAAQSRLSDLLTPSVRLGVTGLSRSGKTVFIMALVRNLIAGGRLPFFRPEAEGRIIRAYLEPQPDDALPRFGYEDHLIRLSGDPPSWPDGTRRVSQLRLTIEYESRSTFRRLLGLERLYVDIIDYPGEWLIDLALLDQSFNQFSASALAIARDPARLAAAKPWLDFIDALDPRAAEDEQVAIKGAKLFADYLARVRQDPRALAITGPGRFLLPGDLDGSPLLTFFPLALAGGAAPPRGSLGAMMARRFESYKDRVVRPFFRDHFSRIDRQIVLVDVLGALRSGPGAMKDLETALDGVLSVFRPGPSSWLSALLGRRIDKVLFAATKADCLPAKSHDRLGFLLKHIIDRRLSSAARDGAGVSAVALAAVRATSEAVAKDGGETLACIRGVPLAGEAVGRRVFDGRTEAVIFPGDLPADISKTPALDALSIVTFRPPVWQPLTTDGVPNTLPHIRLDRALDFLIADYLQ